MSQKFFVTGTDTGIGKTYVSIQLLKLFHKRGYSTLGIKPVATECEEKNGILYSQDALLLQEASSVKASYERVNPLAFKMPVAPNIAAKKENQTLTVSKIQEKLHATFRVSANIYVIEGIGGWHVPLNDHETMANFVMQSDLSVILVIGIKLGCLNHAILTYEAIESSKVRFAGWIANCLDAETLEIEENIKTLQKLIKAPCLSIIEYGKALKKCTPILSQS